VVEDLGAPLTAFFFFFFFDADGVSQTSDSAAPVGASWRIRAWAGTTFISGCTNSLVAPLAAAFFFDTDAGSLFSGSAALVGGSWCK
jgi:hypothetical protein